MSLKQHSMDSLLRLANHPFVQLFLLLFFFKFLAFFLTGLFYYQTGSLLNIDLAPRFMLAIPYSSWATWVFSIILSFPLLVFRKKISWTILAPGSGLKWLITLFVLILIYFNCFSGYNFYIDTGFWFDRLLIFILGLAIFFHPGFILPFLFSCFAFQAQVLVPVFYPYLINVRPLLDALILTLAFMYLRMFISIKTHLLILTIFVAHIANYFVPGIAKMLVSDDVLFWLSNNELYLLPENAHLRGWLSGSLDGVYLFMRDLFLKFGYFFKIITLVIELGCVLFFTSIYAQRVFLVGFILFHLMVFSGAGILFWIWILVDLILIIYTFRYSSFIQKNLNKKSIIFYSVLMLVFSWFLFSAFPLGWLDSRFQWFTTIEVVDLEGKEWYVNKNDMEPYHMQFAHQPFYKHIPFPLPTGNGYSNDLETINTWFDFRPEQVSPWLEKNGTLHLESESEEDYYTFIRDYFIHTNSRKPNHIKGSWFSPPKQLYMFRREGSFKFDRPVKIVRIRYYEYFYYEGSYRLIRSELLKDIVIPYGK